MSSRGEHFYRFGPLSILLYPLSLLYGLLYKLHRAIYLGGLLRRKRLPVPVIVVGNLTVGGTGKTQLVISLARYLSEQGYRPGIIARGYRGRAPTWPQDVNVDSDPVEVGDEPVLMAIATGLPVCAGPDRYLSGRQLIEQHGCNVIVSDDGLQHHRLYRDIEIAVIDGSRRFGNGLLLPAGPLRESKSRLSTVDFIVCRGGNSKAGEIGFEYSASSLVNLKSGNRVMPGMLDSRSVHAVAGIGNPEQFFRMLEKAGLTLSRHAFPDHYLYQPQDLQFDDTRPVVMTAKDAVKCRRWANDRLWYLEITATLPDRLALGIMQRLKELARG
jgi:tetraacyldisaccharide 4'-kinase